MSTDAGSVTPWWDSLDSPTGLYVHIPFCRHRCGYCNFTVLTDRDALRRRMIDAIRTEIRNAAIQYPAKLETVYIGGGTPTQVDDEDLSRLFDVISDSFDLSPNVEWTMEVNPEDVTRERVDRWAATPVNRISMGVQSFDDAKLRTLERFHRGDEAVAAVHRVAERFDNISVDLIFAAPRETIDVWRSDLSTVTELPIRHVSAYSLTYEKGTTFWSRRRRGTLMPVDDDVDADLYAETRQRLPEAGLRQYEISSFASRDRRSRHNLGYWCGRPWLAAGPAATSFARGVRWSNHRSATTYLKRIESSGDPVAERDALSAVDYGRERIAFGLRMIDGVDVQHAGLNDPRRIPPKVRRSMLSTADRHAEHGWLAIDGHRWKLTDRGIELADAIASDYLFA